MMEIRSTEMHTGGEPLRILEFGCSPPEGATLLEKRRDAQARLDHVRRMTVLEPRGHRDMYAALLVSYNQNEAESEKRNTDHAALLQNNAGSEQGDTNRAAPPHNDAENLQRDSKCGALNKSDASSMQRDTEHAAPHLSVLFLHNAGYSTMCGHAVIALARYAVDKGYVKDPKPPEVTVNIECPCGMVEAHVEYDGKSTGQARFYSVPSYLHAKDVLVTLESGVSLQVDICYGGAYYAILSGSQAGLDIQNSPIEDIIRTGREIKNYIRRNIRISHPDAEDLGFIYGTIFTDGKGMSGSSPTLNICVFADGEVDRSPTGSGVSARVAQLVHRGLMNIGDRRTFVNSKTQSRFEGVAARTSRCGENQAVVVEVSGRAYYTGSSTFTLEDGDELGKGFLIK